MPSFAGRNIARHFRVQAGHARPGAVALLAVLIGLGGCGDKAAQPAVTDPQPGVTRIGGSSTATGASDPVGAITGPSGPLDTANWVLPPPFSAGGDEPFWRMEIDDGYFSFRRSGLRAIEEPLVQPRKEGVADVFDTGSLRVVIQREACQTEGGGSGDFSVKVTFDQTDFDGCALHGQTNAASAEAATVAESLVPIDACLAKLGEPALATAVYPRQDGEQTAVALSAKSGAFYECVTENDGASVITIDPIEQGARPSWMNRMRFLRDGVKSMATCADSEDVRVGDKVVGRLLGKACKF